MTFRLPEEFDRANAVVAALLWLGILVVYTLTKAPTLSFWDCGEFIAAAHILGIPHPPGTPAYIIFARIFSIIPFESDICARVNFFSSLCSSLAALFGYLIAVRLLRYWFKNASSAVTRIIIYGGAACGTLFLAFGRTQWNNAVEAEVYGMSMMLFLCILWLTLQYYEHRGTRRGNLLILAIVYLAFFGIGAHMTTFMVLPIAAVVLIVKPDAPRHVWFALGALFVAELYLIFAFSSRPGEVPYWLPVALVTLFFIFYALSYERIPSILLALGVGLVLACLPILNIAVDTPVQSLDYVGIAALIAVSGYAVWLLLTYRKEKASGDISERARYGAIGAGFVLVTDLLTVILISGLHGYIWFLLFTLILSLGTIAMVWRHIRWPILIAFVGVALVIVGIREYFFGSLLALVIVVILGRVKNLPSWRTAVLVVVMAAIGYSIHVFVPIRSSLHPTINENNPSRSLDTTISFLERKQYGSQGMVERMFERRSEWVNQFGNHIRMGFWGFFDEQYGLSGIRFLILFVLGAFGLWELCRRKPEMGVVLLLLLLLTTAGLVLYMNFADGTRIDPATGRDYLEVRDRDYFFTPGFMIFGLLIGMGVTGLIQYLREIVRSYTPAVRNLVVAASMVFFLLPGYALAANYHVCDRSENYVPYDYAYNILICADENAVFFTAGDNDTFPLWCVQEVYGVRKDVRNVNLSLGNTDWYIRQVRDDMGITIRWTDTQIDSLRPYRIPDGRTFRVQDQLIDEIVQNNWGKIPIDFSVTCGPGARKLNGRSIDSLLELHGLSFRVTNDNTGLRVHVDNSIEFLLGPNGYQFHGWNNPNLYLDDASERLVRNFGSLLMYTIGALEGQKRYDEALAGIRRIVDEIPQFDRGVETLAQYYAERGDADDLDTMIMKFGSIDSLGLQVYKARAYRKSDRPKEAEALLTSILERSPHYRPALDELMSHYVATSNLPGMQDILNQWVANNPADVQVREALQQLNDQLEKNMPHHDDSL